MTMDLDKLMDVVRRIVSGIWKIAPATGNGAIRYASIPPFAGVGSGNFRRSTGISLFSAMPRVFDSKHSALNDVTASHSREFTPLSMRELMVLGYVAEGFTNKEIARRLDVSVRTIETYLGRIFRKLNATTRTQAVTIANRNHLLSEV